MAYDSLMIVLLILGFGFVIFFHELGHFLAAKAVGIKVEQFAVGFGHAIVAWRKGIGFHVGTTVPECERRVDAYLTGHQLSRETPGAVESAEKTLGLGDTEYRLNWIPLGGYVKMTGQDDLRPNAQVDDPRAYNRKSVSARMLVVVAGVVMNIILAAIGFMVVFLIGFHVAPARVGGIMPDSPAQRAGLQVGDEIDTLNGKKQWDFTKIALNTALMEEGQPVPMEITRDGRKISLTITPERFKGNSKDFLALGIEAYRDLRGLKDAELADVGNPNDLVLPEELAVKPGETIIAINGKAVRPDDYQVLDEALQSSSGKPVVLTVRNVNGSERLAYVQPHFADPFTSGSFHLVGMVPRARLMSVLPNSPSRGKLRPGDVIESITRNGKTTQAPTGEQLTEILKSAGANSEVVSMTVLRNVDGVEKEKVIPDLQTGLKLEGTDKRGLGIQLGLDEEHSVVADVLPDSPASRADIPRSAVITAIGDDLVSNWYDLESALLDIKPDEPVPVKFIAPSGKPAEANLVVDAAQIGAIHAVRYYCLLQLNEPDSAMRKTSNPFVAAAWGITETRDFILQFYVTLRRMLDGSLSPSNLMGPVGIFIAGKKLAFKGVDWLIWFLAMISANLAVVNFLPIPIVDGGLFSFLILEKIQGRPLSPRTQAIAQYAGMAFLVCVFLFVTYHDLTMRF
jgi:regulator of sigma E protease